MGDRLITGTVLFQEPPRARHLAAWAVAAGLLACAALLAGKRPAPATGGVAGAGRGGRSRGGGQRKRYSSTRSWFSTYPSIPTRSPLRSRWKRSTVARSTL